jgi:dienelactone hydrolase
MSVEPLAYEDGGTPLHGTLYRPVGAPRAAIAVFPTILNPTPAVEAKARALAEAGYLAFLADFYGQTPADFPTAVALSAALLADARRYRRRLHAALEALSRAALGLRQGAIGFCMGGQAVLELARDGADLAVVASFHGLLDTAAPAEPGAIKARMLVCHGDADPLVPREQVVAFWEEMDRAGADWHFHSYSSVVHGFTNPNRPPAGGPVAYDPSADRQSWAAMLSLFGEVFG